MEGLSETQFAYLLLTPALLLLGVIALWPLLSTFRMSLFADSLTGTSGLGNFVGIQNYVELFTGQKTYAMPAPFVPQFDGTLNSIVASALGATLVFTVVSVFFETVIGFGQALVLDQEFYGRRWVRVAIIIPWAVPVVIQGMIFFLLFQPNVGFLVGSENPTILQQLGIFSETPLASATESMLIIIVADIWKTSAFMALLILAGLQSIDRNLYDVARVAGASKWQQFKMITLPLVLPTVLIAMLFRTIAAMRVYGIIDTVSSCQTVPSLSCMVVSGFSQRQFGTAATVAFVTAAIIGVVVSVYIAKFASSSMGGDS
ncbi:carbohydrate ABC transporter permease [Haladaptatus sp. CMSO5]|uniref:carbohydrate ABC transporter permease n=1 Tax=Haladaptatus sp. CMSO5 TaxID=3120514 RepID=UPI003FA5957F